MCYLCSVENICLACIVYQRSKWLKSWAMLHDEKSNANKILQEIQMITTYWQGQYSLHFTQQYKSQKTPPTLLRNKTILVLSTYSFPMVIWGLNQFSQAELGKKDKLCFRYEITSYRKLLNSTKRKTLKYIIHGMSLKCVFAFVGHTNWYQNRA